MKKKWLFGLVPGCLLLFWVVIVFSYNRIKQKDDPVEEKVALLEAENFLLKTKLQESATFLFNQEREVLFLETIDQFFPEKKEKKKSSIVSFMQKQLQAQLTALPAKVILRSPTSWSSFVWVNVGSASNEALQERIVDLHSPVVCGNKIVGMIDLITPYSSRVRLLTDSQLCPSVRVARGEFFDFALLEEMKQLLARLELKTDPEFASLAKMIEEVVQKWVKKRPLKLLAKGEIHGLSKPLWQARHPILKGIGFNYDFEDEVGPSLELRTGRPIDTFLTSEGVVMIEEGDLLITNGLDGLFPAGLLVGNVLKVHPLVEGDYFYSIDVLPSVTDFDALNFVQILPPVQPEAL